MLINLSNHPSAQWDETQKNAALLYGKLKDLPFPAIDPLAGTEIIGQMAEQYEVKIRELLAEENAGAFAVHIMGELTFCFALISRLQQLGITCIASTTTRKTVDNANGTKTVKFGFVRFREYLFLNH